MPALGNIMQESISFRDRPCIPPPMPHQEVALLHSYENLRQQVLFPSSFYHIPPERRRPQSTSTAQRRSPRYTHLKCCPNASMASVQGPFCCADSLSLLFPLPWASRGSSASVLL